MGSKNGFVSFDIDGHKNTVTKVSWNDNGNWLLTASRDQLIKLYDIRAMKELCSLKGHHKEVTSVAWHPVYEVGLFCCYYLIVPFLIIH